MAEQAVATARRVADLFRNDRECIQKLGRLAGSALQVHLAMQEQPVLSITRAAQRTKLSPPTVGKVMDALGDAPTGIVRELTGKRRNRLFGYDAYLKIPSEGTEQT